MPNPDPHKYSDAPPPRQHALQQAIDRDRAALAASLDALQNRVAPPAPARDALDVLKSNAAPFTSALETAVRANPLALALTATGLAWLIFGGKKSPPTPSSAHENLTRWADDGGPVPGEDETADARQADPKTLRDRAADARHTAQDHAKSAATLITQTVKDHPLITGAISLALGSALAAQQPRPQNDDPQSSAALDPIRAEMQTLLSETRLQPPTPSLLATTLAEVAGKVTDRLLDRLLPPRPPIARPPSSGDI